jgi:hypothetical protein
MELSSTVKPFSSGPSLGEIFGALIEEVRFAIDSALEESGFEPSVPLGPECAEGTGRHRRLARGPELNTRPSWSFQGSLRQHPADPFARRDRGFESAFLHRRVYEPSVPLDMKDFACRRAQSDAVRGSGVATRGAAAQPVDCGRCRLAL